MEKQHSTYFVDVRLHPNSEFIVSDLCDISVFAVRWDVRESWGYRLPQRVDRRHPFLDSIRRGEAILGAISGCHYCRKASIHHLGNFGDEIVMICVLIDGLFKEGDGLSGGGSGRAFRGVIGLIGLSAYHITYRSYESHFSFVTF